MGSHLDWNTLCERADSVYLLTGNLALICEFVERWNLLNVYIAFFRWLALGVIVLGKN